MIEGKIDTLLFNDKIGILNIFEFKFNRSGKSGLDQILNRRYMDGLKNLRMLSKQSVKHDVLIDLPLTLVCLTIRIYTNA